MSLRVHPEKLDGVNRVLDLAIEERVILHAQRRRREISVEHYLEGLAAVRAVESVLEETRRHHGARQSRAIELTRAERDGTTPPHDDTESGTLGTAA